MNKRWLQLGLGIVTATGGFLDAGARFGFGLVWVLLLVTLAIVLLVDMSGRFAAVAKKPYAAAIREHFGVKLYLVPLTGELIAETLLLAAELGGIAIALSLVTGLSWRVLFPVAALLVWLLVWRAPFDLIENGPALLGIAVLSFIVGIAVLGRPSRDLTATLWHYELAVASCQLAVGSCQLPVVGLSKSHASQAAFGRDVRAAPTRATGLVLGGRAWLAWLARLHLLRHLFPDDDPPTIPWSAVARFEPCAVTLKPGFRPDDRKRQRS